MPNATIDAAITQITVTETVIDSAVVLINSINTIVEEAVNKALAGGATAADLAPVNDALVVIKAKTNALAAAVAANTPSAPPVPPAPPHDIP